MAMLVASTGCSPDQSGDVPIVHNSHKIQRVASSPHGKTFPDGEAVPAKIMTLMKLKENGDTVEYLAAARDFLSANRDDFVATDVMTIYARGRMTNEFQVFGHSYATNSPALLLEFAEIANNEAWHPMVAEFAQSVVNKETASYAELYRAARFLLSQGNVESVAKSMPRINSLAAKRYQKEDAELLTCELAVCQGDASEETIKSLGRLANEAMMPQVRKSAARLLETIQSKE